MIKIYELASNDNKRPASNLYDQMDGLLAKINQYTKIAKIDSLDRNTIESKKGINIPWQKSSATIIISTKFRWNDVKLSKDGEEMKFSSKMQKALNSLHGKVGIYKYKFNYQYFTNRIMGNDVILPPSAHIQIKEIYEKDKITKPIEVYHQSLSINPDPNYKYNLKNAEEIIHNMSKNIYKKDKIKFKVNKKTNYQKVADLIDASVSVASIVLLVESFGLNPVYLSKALELSTPTKIFHKNI